MVLTQDARNTSTHKTIALPLRDYYESDHSILLVHLLSAHKRPTTYRNEIILKWWQPKFQLYQKYAKENYRNNTREILRIKPREFVGENAPGICPESEALHMICCVFSFPFKHPCHALKKFSERNTNTHADHIVS